MPDLFISHATVEDAAADRLAAALQEAGLSTWIDHQGGINPGDPSWDRKIREAIMECREGVLLMSPASLKSRICEAECDKILKLKGRLYVAYLATVEDHEIWLTITTIQRTDLRTDFEKGAAALARAVKGERAPDLPTATRARVTGEEVMRVHLPYLDSVPLTGREDDLSRLRGMLGPHVTQLIAVGGTGKSRMAAELALTHPNGAVWHRCDETSFPEQITDLIRRHYRMEDATPQSAVLDALHSAPPLIVVDNAEAVTPERHAAYAALLAQITARKAPTLLTARAVWHELKPRRDHHPLPIGLAPAAQIALGFAAAEGVTLSETDATALAEAGSAHPRLIEFAVGQLHDERKPAAVLKMLRELKHEDVQEALDEMIHQTVRQMSEQARHGTEAERLLRRLTVFRGSFDGAALAALRPSDMDDDAADEALIVLKRWGFVRQEDERLRLDEVVTAALTPDGDAQARHFAHYAALHGDVSANNDEDRHPLIETDWPNLRAALDWGWGAEAEAAVDFTWALNYFMQFRLSLSERRVVLETAQAVAERIEYSFGQANTLKAMGDVSLREADLSAARTVYGQALPLYEAIGDRLGQANTLRALGDVSLREDELSAARTVYGQALPLYEAIGDRLGQANTLQGLGDVSRREDELSAARMFYGQALPIYEAIGARLGQANTLRALGDVSLSEADLSVARTFYGQALPIYEAIGARLGQANTLRALGDVSRREADLSAARTFYGQALPLFEAIGDRLGQANTLWALGDVSLSESDLSAAREFYGQALPIYEAIGDRLGQANTLRALGDVSRREADLSAAREFYGQALPIYEAIGARLGQANTLMSLGDLCVGQKLWSDAVMYYQQALPIARAIQSRLGTANILYDYGLAQFELGQQEAGLAALRECKAIFEAIQERRWAANAARRLNDLLQRAGLPPESPSENSADVGQNTLPQETITMLARNTVAVKTGVPEKRDEWRAQIAGLVSDWGQRGADYANEVAFASALLAILDDQPVPLLASDNPYAGVMAQVVTIVSEHKA